MLSLRPIPTPKPPTPQQIQDLLFASINNRNLSESALSPGMAFRAAVQHMIESGRVGDRSILAEAAREGEKGFFLVEGWLRDENHWDVNRPQDRGASLFVAAARQKMWAFMENWLPEVQWTGELTENSAYRALVANDAPQAFMEYALARVPDPFAPAPTGAAKKFGAWALAPSDNVRDTLAAWAMDRQAQNPASAAIRTAWIAKASLLLETGAAIEKDLPRFAFAHALKAEARALRRAIDAGRLAVAETPRAVPDAGAPAPKRGSSRL